ncbi:hypothetical protein C8Q79DRAFT_1114411 [Trametes meyenii]|nr:hypothetical protein C8Q79DRAFT_1114411 [Trametes meyenii]
MSSMPSQTAHTPEDTPSWDPMVPSEMDEHSTASRSSPVRRLVRRLGLSNKGNQDLSHLHGPYNSSSSGSLAKSFASTTAPTFDSDEREASRPGSIFSRRAGHAPKKELHDIAEMLDDDNLAWVPPHKSRRRKN